MNATVADSVTFRCPYLVHFVHCSLVVMDHSVAASNLLRTRRVQIQHRTFCNNFFLSKQVFCHFKIYLLHLRRQILKFHLLRIYVNYGIPCFIYVRLGIPWNSMHLAHKSRNSMISVLTYFMELHALST